MAIILFGGSFDPVHNGHLAMARAGLDYLPSATLLWIPAAQSPFKTHREPAAEGHRLAMCRLAAQADPRMEVTDVEFSLAKPSYTVQTVQTLRARRPDEYYFLCGADAFLSLQRWKEYETLIGLVTFLAVDRRGALPQAMVAQKRAVERDGGKVRLLTMQRVPVSSTHIRERIKNGQSVAGLLPEPVERYIQENKLYRE